MATWIEKAFAHAEIMEKQRPGSQVDVVEANPVAAILRVTFPGINPRRPGGTEHYTVPIKPQDPVPNRRQR